MTDAEKQRRYAERHPDRVEARVKAWRAANPEHIKAYQAERALRARADDLLVKRRANFRTKYALTLEGVQAMLDAQDGVCLICRKALTLGGRSATSGHVDHDHTTGRVRGVLCSNCNTALGKFRDDPDLLRSAIAYLTLG